MTMDVTRMTLERPVNLEVNVYRVGNTLVDTAHPDPATRSALCDELDGGRLAGVDRVLLTHPHLDHVGGSLTLPSLARLPHVVPTGVSELLADYSQFVEQFRTQVLTMARETLDDPDPYMQRGIPVRDEYDGARIHVEREVEGGDEVVLGPCRCRVVDTPGHSARHVGVYHPHSGTFFSGDLVSQSGYFTWAPDCDLVQYVESIERVRRLGPDRLLPGHGPPIATPDAHLDAALEKVETNLGRIREAVQRRGEATARDVAVEVFGASGRGERPLTLAVAAHFEYLETTGDLSLEFGEGSILARAR